MIKDLDVVVPGGEGGGGADSQEEGGDGRGAEADRGEAPRGAQAAPGMFGDPATIHSSMNQVLLTFIIVGIY